MVNIVLHNFCTANSARLSVYEIIEYELTIIQTVIQLELPNVFLINYHPRMRHHSNS